jgi:hypothetical protein
MKVCYSPFVFAENRGLREGVWLHSGLKHQPKLKKQLLAHERQHSGRITWKDLKLDFLQWDFASFRMLVTYFSKHPSAFFFYVLPFSFNVRPFRLYVDYVRVLTTAVMAFLLVLFLIIP